MDGLEVIRVREVLDGNFIFVRANFMKTKALIDTGAQKSCISEAFVQKLRLSPTKQVKGEGKYLFTADGKPIQIQGTTELSVKIHGLSIPFTFHVLRGLNHNIILGCDFLTQTNAQIDMSNGFISFCDDLVSASLARPRESLLRSLAAIEVPGQSEAVLPVKIPQGFHAKCAIIEPTELGLNNLIVARSVVQPLGNRTLCKVLNPTNAAVRLNRGDIISKISPLTDQILCELSEFNENSEISRNDDVPIETCREALKKKDIKIGGNDLTESQQNKLIRLLYDNLDIFASSLSELPGTDLVKHHIDTGDSKPVRLRAYRQTPQVKREMQKQVDDMLKSGIIEESDSPWSSPALLVRKASGEFRFVTDFRQVNKLTKPVFWPLPTMEEIIDTVSDCNPSIFSLLDMKSGYFQISMDDESKPRTAFSVGGSHYQYIRMANGLCNAPHTFQALLTKVLGRMLFTSALCYIDDVLMMSQNFDLHCQHLQTVFDKFRKANLRLHPSKCVFAVPRIKYLGHILSKEGLSVDPDKTEVIRSYPRPKTQKQVRSFLGVLGYYRRFVDKFSVKSSPLRELLKKDSPFVWEERHENAFELMKEALISPPVLIYPDLNKTFTLTTDASTNGLAYILSQRDEGNREHVVAYGGRGLRGAEARYPISQMECLAIIEGVKHYHTYLAHKPFEIVTDHVSLKFLQSLKVSAHNRLARWALFLQPYKFTVNYKPGRLMTTADSISRRQYEPPVVPADDEELDDEAFIAQIDTDVFQCEPRLPKPPRRQWTSINIVYDVDAEIETKPDAQLNEITSDATTDDVDYDIPNLIGSCPDFKPIMDYLRDGTLSDDDKVARRTILKSENYTYKNGYLYHLHTPRAKRLNEINPVVEQICVPITVREPLVRAYHDNNCHPGFQRTYESIREKYYWEGMYENIHCWITTCDLCLRSKSMNHPQKAKLKSLPVVDVFDRIHIDFLGPLPASKEGDFKHLLVVVDSTSLYPAIFPTKSTTAEEVAEVLYANYFCTFGAPLTILTDRGAVFRSKLVAELCRIFKVKQIYTSSYHPCTNSRAERFNSTILKSLRIHLSDQRDWVKYIPAILYSYRSSVTTSTGVSPYFCVFGKPMRHGLDVELNTEGNVSPDVDTYLKNLLDRLKVTHEVVKQNIEDCNFVTKSKYDEKAVEADRYQLGDMVLMYDPTNKKAQCPKFKKRWNGPLTIIDKTDDGILYKLRDCQTGKETKAFIHFNRIKPYTTARDAFYRKNALVSVPTEKPQESVKSDSVDIGDGWYTIDRVCGKKKVRGKLHFLVRWQDGTKSYEPKENVSDYAINQYYVRVKQNQKRRQNRK